MECNNAQLTSRRQRYLLTASIASSSLVFFGGGLDGQRVDILETQHGNPTWQCNKSCINGGFNMGTSSVNCKWWVTRGYPARILCHK